MKNLKGLATGIGSLPYKNAEEALDLIFQYLPEAPFWPQLPKVDFREGMVAQFSQNLPCLRVSPEGIVFDARNQDKELENFYEQIITNNREYFKISPDFARGLYAFYQRLEKTDLKNVKFIKCHITGPFTTAAGMNNESGVSLLHDHTFMQVIIKALAMKGLWQIDLFKKFSKKIIIFLDEPYLGAFGSAYTPINRNDVIKGLMEITEALKSEDILLGVHCCGNTDWSILTDIPNIDIISFDAYAFLERFILYADNLKSFFKRDGILCWGIVPTQEFSAKQTPDMLLDKIKGGLTILEKKGIDRALLLDRLLISPACGLGSLDTEKARQIFQLLAQTSSLIQKSL